MMDSLLLVVQVGSAFSCVIMAVLNWLAWRRYRVLNQVLAKLVLDAHANAHLPIWVPWSQMTGLKIRLQLVERE